jgi:hypothetical protein
VVGFLLISYDFQNQVNQIYKPSVKLENFDFCIYWHSTGSYQLNKFKETVSKLDEKSTNVWNFRIWAPFRPLFELKYRKVLFTNVFLIHWQVQCNTICMILIIFWAICNLYKIVFYISVLFPPQWCGLVVSRSIGRMLPSLSKTAHRQTHYNKVKKTNICKLP